MELRVEIEGQAVSNLNEYRQDFLNEIVPGSNTLDRITLEGIMDIIREENKDLKTDEDFVRAGGLVKKLVEVENKLCQAREEAIERTGSINVTLNELADLERMVRTVRLETNKLVEGGKADRKIELIDSAFEEIKAFADQVHSEHAFPSKLKPDALVWRDELVKSIKGRKNFKTTSDALHVACARAKRIIAEDAECKRQALELIDGTGKPLLFPDREILAFKPRGELEAIVSERIARDQLQRERDEIARKERERLEKERAEKEAQEALEAKEQEEASKDIPPPSAIKHTPECEIQEVSRRVDDALANPTPQRVAPPLPERSTGLTQEWVLVFEGTREQAVEAAQATKPIVGVGRLCPKAHFVKTIINEEKK